MQLSYLRIKQGTQNVPKSLIEKDFNFSAKYNFRLNSNKLLISKISNENFFNINNLNNNILNISSIIGENGMGKSSLLSFITKILYEKEKRKEKILDNTILIFEEDNDINIFSNQTIEYVIDDSLKKQTNINLNVCKLNDFLLEKKFGTIFYSSSFSWDNYFENSKENLNYYNMSLDNILRKDKKNYEKDNLIFEGSYEDDRFDNNDFSNIKNNSIRNNLIYILNKEKKGINQIEIKFKIFNDKNNFKKLRLKQSNIEITILEQKIYHILNTIMKNYNETRENKFKATLLFLIIDSFYNEIYSVCHNVKIVDNIFDFINTNYVEKPLENNIEIDYYYNCFLDYFEIIKKLKIKDKNLIDNLQEMYCNVNFNNLNFNDLENKSEFFNYLNSVNKLLNNVSEKCIRLLKFYNSNLSIFEIEQYEDDNIYLYDETRLILKKDSYNVYGKYLLNDQENFDSQIFEYNYPIQSAGIHAKIDLYSAINYVTNKINLRRKQNRVENYLILLDEVDLYFHPKWSREFIYDFIDFLNSYDNLNFQIIITTNKPYIISDLPKENVIMLGNESLNESNTFASNIITLLSNNYFMDNYVGKFATTKINNIISKINNILELQEGNPNEADALRNEINKIGDNLLKMTLLEKLDRNLK